MEVCASLEDRAKWDTFFEGGKLVQVLVEPKDVRNPRHAAAVRTDCRG